MKASINVCAAILTLLLSGCHCCTGLLPWHGCCEDDRGCPDKGHRLKKRPSVTARPASPANMGEPCGFPFYLPKPLLVISKNVYHVEEATIGLTDSAPIPTTFDHQGDYAAASLNTNAVGGGAAPPPAAPADGTKGGGTAADDAKTSGPFVHSSGAPSAPRPGDTPTDGLGPNMFFTYEIVFVPDLTQKYVLDVDGGAGEIRAAINLVNGWQFTGLGPYYMKDSSTAQNLFARGVQLNLGLQGAADVVNSIANLQSKAGTGGKTTAAEVAKVAQAMAAAATEQTYQFDFVDPEKWVDEYVVTEDGERIKTGRKVPPSIERYAEIYVYEAELCEGQMVWKPITNHTFSREFLGTVQLSKNPAVGNAAAAAVNALSQAQAQAASPGDAFLEQLPAAAPNSQLAQSIVEKTLAPPPAPCKKGCLGFLQRCRGSLVNRFVTVPAPAAAP
jgi:hypothetical protein